MGRRTIFAMLVLVLGAMALVAPIAYAGGGCHESTTTQGTTTTVDMKDLCFHPAVTTVDPGSTVKWTNFDQELHVIVGVGGSWYTEAVSQEGSAGVRFDSPGTYPYWCEVHPGMIGTVVVGDGEAGTKTAGTGPVAVAVSDESDPPSGSGTAPVTDTTPRAAVSSSDGMSGMAVLGIAILAGLFGYGAAHVVRRREVALLATKKLG